MYVELSYLIEDFYELPELFFYSSKVSCFKCWQCPGINPDPCLALDWEWCIVKSAVFFWTSDPNSIISACFGCTLYISLYRTPDNNCPVRSGSEEPAYH